jgi:signal peptidase II
LSIGLAALFVGVVALDQASKMVIKNSMLLGQSIPVLGDAVRLTFVENDGIAFGLHVKNAALFTAFSIAACVFIVVYFWKQRQEGGWLKAALILILGGAIGNVIDRVAFGKVVDFIDVGIRTVRWPVFNVADSAVVIGMGILIVLMIMEEKARPAAKADAPAE